MAAKMSREDLAVSDRASPYKGLPPERYWKSGVSEQAPTETKGLYKKRYEILPTDRIATAGSCFAQHIARQMRKRGFNVLDTEPAPATMSDAEAQNFGYRLYSARYGNLYHCRQLLQLVKECLGQHVPSDIIWEKDFRYYDALRPSVEPGGHETPVLVQKHRAAHLARVKELLHKADIFVFTFGLTEAWEHIESGTIYPGAPGTIAGSYDPSIYRFKNFTYPELMADFLEFREIMRGINPNIKFLVTVSPVPLIATASDEHVLAATMYSKSVLRAVTGDLYHKYPDIDYFPSYDLIASPFSRGMFFHPSLRTVTDNGVENAMRVFFSEHQSAVAAPTGQAVKAVDGDDDHKVVCEDVLLEAFGA